jgi:hypothetical protein
MRVIVLGSLSLAALALVGCSSSSVPMWAVASANSQHVGEKRLAHSRLQSIPVARSHEADVEASSRKQGNDVKMAEPAAPDSVTPVNDDHRAFRELDRKMEDENRKMNEAITICRAC